jgi:hypothetical protein
MFVFFCYLITFHSLLEQELINGLKILCFMFLFSEDNYITPHQTIHFFFPLGVVIGVEIHLVISIELPVDSLPLLPTV